MSVVTAGSPLVGTPINLVRGLIRLGLIKDLKLATTVHRPLEWLKKGLERKVELLGIEPRTFGLPCQCSATELQLPTATKGMKEGWLLVIGILLHLPFKPLFQPFQRSMNSNGQFKVFN